MYIKMRYIVYLNKDKKEVDKIIHIIMFQVCR
jgi:hypothetical protein